MRQKLDEWRDAMGENLQHIADGLMDDMVSRSEICQFITKILQPTVQYDTKQK
ncbi:hypothetical protein [Pleurocapsa sp. PCC 7327]|uniref:hypothetical protein n=1 Tax=Pleurocapsa sp. PCC 7327 TaxID=118163 RepID=UPI000311D5AC|nr:hypothetical protein [Pleurocapsa sp. PCC 7327]